MGILLLLAAGCQAAQTSVAPTLTQTPTLPATAEPTSTREPQFLVMATEVSKTTPPMLVLTQPTAQSVDPQQTVTPPTAKPALVQIESPGPRSKVRDFLWVRANVYPGDSGNVNILLTGEDGRVIASRELFYSNWKTGWLSIAEQIAFTPLAASETALLSVFTRDAFGRTVALTSVRVLMLQVGPEEIELPGFHGDPRFRDRAHQLRQFRLQITAQLGNTGGLGLIGKCALGLQLTCIAPAVHEQRGLQVRDEQQE